MRTIDVVNRQLAQIFDAVNALPVDEKAMVMCTLGEHCRAYAQTILAHDYHRALYASEVSPDGRRVAE